MKRNGLYLIAMILLMIMPILLNDHPVAAETLPTATPSTPPTASATPAYVAVKPDRVYFHTSGLLSLLEPDGWPLPDQNAEELAEPVDTSTLTRAGITFINKQALSVVHTFVEKNPDRKLITVDDQNKLFDEAYLHAAWANYNGGWKELSRRTDGKRFIIDFQLYLDSDTYLARQESRVEGDWLVVMRLVAPGNNPRLIDDLDRAIWPTVTLYQDAALTPFNWGMIVAQTDGYFLRVPRDWSNAAAKAGAPMTVRGNVNGTPVTLQTRAEHGKSARSEQIAQNWVKALHKDATILGTAVETRSTATGYSVAYSTHDENGAPESGLVVLLNGPAYTLFSSDILIAREGINLLAGSGVDPDLKSLRVALVVIPAPRAVYGDLPHLLPSSTPAPSPTLETPTIAPTLDPAAFDMSTAKKFTSPDGLFSLLLPRGWQTANLSAVPQIDGFYLGDEANPFAGLIVGVGNPQALGILSGQTVPDSPQRAMEALKQQAQQNNTTNLKLGEITESTIGSLQGFAMHGTYMTDTLHMTEIRIASATSSQWVYVVTQAKSDLSPRAQVLFGQMIDSLKIDTTRLASSTPAPTVTPTPTNRGTLAPVL